MGIVLLSGRALRQAQSDRFQAPSSPYRWSGTVPSQLTWAPPGYPSYTGFQTIHITNSSNRNLTLDDNTDYMLVLDEAINTLTTDGYGGIWVSGGRNVVLIGGHITINTPPSTTLTSTFNATDTTMSVASTTGFASSSGLLRIQGTAWFYTGTTPTSFTGISAAFGGSVYPNGSLAPYSSGVTVWPGEYQRQAAGFVYQTGTVHVEGILCDGPGISEGIDFSGVSGEIVQLQNCRIGPLTAFDQTLFLDNHPDCCQLYSGPDIFRMDRCTGTSLFDGVLLGDVTQRLVPTADLRYSNFNGVSNPLQNLPHSYMINDEGCPNLSLTDIWAFPGPHKPQLVYPFPSSPNFELVQFGTPPGGDFCPAGIAGTSYVSPGYL